MGTRSTSSIDRLAGYKKSLEENNIPYVPKLVYNVPPEIEEGYIAMRNILESGEQVETLFCGCDILSIGAMEAIFEKGLDVPKDIRVCGYDDIEFAAYLKRPLTTIRQPKEIIGVKGIDLLLKKINHKTGYPDIVILKSDLVVRQSA
jgi:DNA-binding LacI/PurR family transcriptional regulator